MALGEARNESSDVRPAISVVIPAHNSAAIIENTLEQLAKRLADVSAEVIVVENGSADDTLAILERLTATWPAGSPALRVMTSPKGLGYALRAGIIASTGRAVVTTADDLPFGFDEIDAGERLGFPADTVVIASKAHPESVVERSLLRTIFTGGFRVLRWAILGMRTADPQGTYAMDGDWLRAVATAFQEPGFLVTTEMAYAAEVGDVRIIEVPAHLRGASLRTRVAAMDIYRMGIGLFGLRYRRRLLRAANERYRQS